MLAERILLVQLHRELSIQTKIRTCHGGKDQKSYRVRISEQLTKSVPRCISTSNSCVICICSLISDIHYNRNMQIILYIMYYDSRRHSGVKSGKVQFRTSTTVLAQWLKSTRFEKNFQRCKQPRWDLPNDQVSSKNIFMQ